MTNIIYFLVLFSPSLFLYGMDETNSNSVIQYDTIKNSDLAIIKGATHYSYEKKHNNDSFYTVHFYKNDYSKVESRPVTTIEIEESNKKGWRKRYTKYCNTRLIDNNNIVPNRLLIKKNRTRLFFSCIRIKH